MLLSSNACKWLEPMCIVCCTLLNGPFLHLVCDNISSLEIKLLSFVHNLMELLVNLLWKTLLHNCIVKYVLSKDVCYVEIFLFAHILHPFCSSIPLSELLFSNNV